MRSENRPGGRRRPSFIEEARRAQIIAAARETVAEVGYAHASLAQIAERAGISKSVISYHFDGKAELVEQMTIQFFEDAWAYMEPRVTAARTPAERIRAWVRSQLEFFAAHRTGFLAMAEVAGNHRRADGTRPFESMEQEELEALAGILAEGQAGGEFRDFPPQVVALIINHTVEGVLGRWVYGDLTDLEAHLPELLAFIDHAIRREPS